ncbi:hypothetical protein O4H61_14735 [Roseovarius aestuarii]|nr:hypothetical protein [Roseovarius aestuarii]
MRAVLIIAQVAILALLAVVGAQDDSQTESARHVQTETRANL